MMGPARSLAIAAAAFALALAAGGAGAQTILDTKHNLSVTGTGAVRAISETRVCVFCHTPHNASPRTPLWNREVAARNYTLFSSPDPRRVVPDQPLAPSRLCLSCHDGVIAPGAVLNPASGIALTRALLPGSPTLIGTDLSDDHPISFSYAEAAAADPALRTIRPGDLVFYQVGGIFSVECPTCHDPHKDRFLSPDKGFKLTGKFLAVDNRRSGLCLRCHDLPGWTGSPHESSHTAVDPAVFPVTPRQWPTWTEVSDWGCLCCHVSHGSESGPNLLYRPTEAETCALCHADGGDPHADSRSASNADTAAPKGIIAQTEKMSAHPMSTLLSPAAAASSRRFASDGEGSPVSCADCHNAHEMSGSPAGGRTAAGRAGAIPGSLRGVSGVDRAGAAVPRASAEYEICFKCHGDGTTQTPFTPRVVASANARLSFDPGNASFHPVVAPARSPLVPSLGTTLEPTLRPSSRVTCSDCHSDDNGKTRGPHGSSFAPILRERYETADGTTESRQSYALCYRCHDRASILADQSFRAKVLRTTGSGGGHRGHLEAGAPCSACHDAHGVPPAAGTGDHEHLINFDTRIARAASPGRAPSFSSRGFSSGSCTLVCHGRTHTDESYP